MFLPLRYHFSYSKQKLLKYLNLADQLKKSIPVNFNHHVMVNYVITPCYNLIPPFSFTNRNIVIILIFFSHNYFLSYLCISFNFFIIISKL